MINGHGGNIYAMAGTLGCRPNEIIDFSSNINPLGCMPALMEFTKEQLGSIAALPQVDSRRVINAFANYYQIPPQCVLAGCGTTEFIYRLPAAMHMQKVLIVGPTYADYADACRLHGIAPDFFFTTAETAFHPDLQQLACQAASYDTVFICNPNNPTGVRIPLAELRDVCLGCQSTRFIIDESYLPFVPQADQHSLVKTEASNIIVLHSFSKIFGIPGLRIGFMLATPSIIREIKKHLLPWGVNAMAHSAAEYILGRQGAVSAFMQQTWDYLEDERQALIERMSACEKVICFPSSTSFILCQLSDDWSAAIVCHQIGLQKMLIRDCSNFEGLNDQYIRIALKTPGANLKLTEALLNLLNTGSGSPQQTTGAPA